MRKNYTLLMMLAVSLSVYAGIVCKEDQTVNKAVRDIRHMIAKRPLAEKDTELINTIISNQLKGLMLKVVPNFTDNGTAVYGEIISQMQQFGGATAPKGQEYGRKVLAVLGKSAE